MCMGNENKEADSMSAENQIVDLLTINCLAYNVWRARPATSSNAYDLAERYCKVLGYNEDGDVAKVFDAYRKIVETEDFEIATGQGRR